VVDLEASVLKDNFLVQGERGDVDGSEVFDVRVLNSVLDIVAAFVVAFVAVLVYLVSVLTPSLGIFLDNFGKLFEPVHEVHLLDFVVSRAGHNESGVLVLDVVFSTLVPLEVNTNHEFAFPQLLFAVTHAVLQGELFDTCILAGSGLDYVVVSADENADGGHFVFNGRVLGAVGTMAISLLHGLHNEIVVFKAN